MPVPPKVWLVEDYDRIIRGNKEFQGKMNYIIDDPVKPVLLNRDKIRLSGGTGFQPVQEFSIYRKNLPNWERTSLFYKRN